MVTSTLIKDYAYVRTHLTCATYDAIYLSPHLDDVAFSCSGTICAQKAQGLRVLVITLFAGEPRPPYSPLAQAYHQLWGLAADASPYRRRQEEDEQAMRALEVDFLWLNWLDAIYRLPNLADFSQINDYASDFSHDAAFPLLQEWLLDLQRAYPGATLVAPLGIGGHRDHRLVFQAVLKAPSSARKLFYEDFPYAAYHVEEAAELARIYQLAPLHIDIARFLDRRILITGLYQSQHAMLFYPPSAFGETIRAYAGEGRQAGWRERYWRL